MANEIRADWFQSATLYACVREHDGDVWSGSAFESWGTDSRTAADYAISLTAKNGSRYVADFPSAIPAGSYDIQIFLQAGASPADPDTDTFLGTVAIEWNGSSPVYAINSIAIKSQGNLGDYKEDETVYFTWDCGGGSLSTAGSIRIYANDGTGEISAPTGITDTRDFDGVSGLNMCAIDLSANANYSPKRDYSIVLVGAVLNSLTINVVLATFSVEQRYQGASFIKDH